MTKLIIFTIALIFAILIVTQNIDIAVGAGEKEPDMNAPTSIIMDGNGRCTTYVDDHKVDRNGLIYQTVVCK